MPLDVGGIFNPSLVGTVTSALPVGSFRARLSWTSNTQITLGAYGGNAVEVNGQSVSVQSGIICATTQDTIQFDATDSGFTPSASTFYYVYLSNASVGFLPSSLALSVQAPTLVNGVYYLGSTGDAASWRFVGAVYLDAAVHFTDTDAARNVVNYYNRLRARLLANPGYTDDNAQTGVILNSAVFAPINGGTGDFVEYCSLGEDALDLRMQLTQVTALLNSATWGIGDDSTTTCAVAAKGESNVGTDQVSCGYSVLHSAGRHKLSMLGYTNATNITWAADDVRRGGASDPRQTFLVGTCYK